MSLVTEIISTFGKQEIEDLNSKIAELTDKITMAKLEAENIVDSRYTKFKDQLEESKGLASKLSTLSKDMDDLSFRIEKQTKHEICNSTSELKTLSTALNEMNMKIVFVKEIVDVDLMLNSVKEELTNKNYCKVAEMLNFIKTTLKQDGNLTSNIPDLVKALRNEAILQEGKFLYDLDNIWKESLVCMKVQSIENLPKYSLNINIENPLIFTQLVKALQQFADLDIKLQRLADKLMKNIITPIITEKCSVDVKNIKNNTMLLEISMISSEKPTTREVIANLNETFDFLFVSFEIDVKEDFSFVGLLGQKMSTEFCELFIKQCLADAIPSNVEERESYNEVIQETEELQEKLVSKGFLRAENMSILEYAKNVDIHFANKMCELNMSRARLIMHKDLHDTTEVQPQFPTIPIFSSSLEESQMNQTGEFASLSKSTLQFPQCQISKSVLDLMELIMEVLKEAGSSTEMRAVRLYLTARKIIEMYCAIMPAYHKKFLDTLPQQAAIFHNNCMYLAHQLLTLGSEFHALLSQVLPTQSITFVDQMSKLRQIGSQVFLGQMQTQRKQLLEILRDSGLSTLGEGDRLPPSTEKSIRQCLRQLELLQRVWQSVLPSNVYNKAIGTLLNTLVEELIVRVSTSEDIPAESATDLVTVFTTVLTRAPGVLQEASEVHQFVKRWRAFEELVLILGANLQAIDNRWADGKGPLAHEFSPDQVKQLVRALFQNTDRRAGLLSKIK